MHHLKSIGEFKLELQSGNAQFRSKLAIFLSCHSHVTLKFNGCHWNNRAPLLYYVKLCASFQSHQWIKSRVTIRKRFIRVKIGNFFVLCDLEIWRITLKNKGAHLLCCFKLCASFHSHQWIQTEVTIWKRLIWVKINNFFLAVWPWNLMDDLEKH